MSVHLLPPAAGQLSPRDWAIYKQLWKLSKEERSVLDSFYTYRTTVEQFMSRVETEHPHKDFLVLHKIPYEVCYIDCSHSLLTELAESTKTKKRSLLLNFRRKQSWQLSLVLVWLPHNESKIENANERYGEL